MNLGDAASGISALVAIGAAAVAFAAWRAAARAAKAAERSAKVDEQAWRHQQTPSFTATVEAGNNGSWHRLALRLDGSADLDDVVVELLDNDVSFTVGQHGIDQSEKAHPRTGWVYTTDGKRCGLRLGDTAKWRISAVKQYVEKDELSLRVVAQKDADNWPVLVSVEVPKSIKRPPYLYSF